MFFDATYDFDLPPSSPVTEYRICVSNRKVNCRMCVNKIEKGQLRINIWKEGDPPNRFGEGITHARCFITIGDGHSYIAVPDDLVNFEQLSGANKELVRAWARNSEYAYDVETEDPNVKIDKICPHPCDQHGQCRTAAIRDQSVRLMMLNQRLGDSSPGQSQSASTSSTAPPNQVARTNT